MKKPERLGVKPRSGLRKHAGVPVSRSIAEKSLVSNMKETTIAAISTAYGEAGIGIVRMSGPRSLEILRKAFVPHACGGDAASFEFAPRHMYYGQAVDVQGSVIDECLAVYMPGPASYTGEDVAEIQCHGSVISYKRILAALLEAGAVPAERGEFTKRAFMNGKMDLAQAEAVIDLIKARSGRGFDCAVEQYSGALSEKVRAVRAELLDELVQLTVNMDYPDEDIEEVVYASLLNRLSAIDDEVLKLQASSEEGRILKEGLRVAIVGRPNVGKSSVLNMLLRSNRSIVTDIPGTTRDTIEEQISLRGITVCFVDTAGIRESGDLVESMGIERSKEAFNQADLILLVLDASAPLEKEDEELLRAAAGRPVIVIANKQDLPARDLKEDIVKITGQAIEPLLVSAINGGGLETLEDKIEDFVTGGKVRREDDVIVTNVRHARLLKQASEDLKQAMGLIKAGEAMDLIEMDVRSAFDRLGEITGETAGDEVLTEVFSRFCLGK